MTLWTGNLSSFIQNAQIMESCKHRHSNKNNTFKMADYCHCHFHCLGIFASFRDILFNLERLCCGAEVMFVANDPFFKSLFSNTFTTTERQTGVLWIVLSSNFMIMQRILSDNSIRYGFVRIDGNVDCFLSALSDIMYTFHLLFSTFSVGSVFRQLNA